MALKLSILAASALFALRVEAIYNGLAITPQMGCELLSSEYDFEKFADGLEGTIGTPSVATYQKTSLFKLLSSSSTTVSKTWDTTTLSSTTAGASAAMRRTTTR